jgi:hypothetical protein
VLDDGVERTIEVEPPASASRTKRPNSRAAKVFLLLRSGINQNSSPEKHQRRSEMKRWVLRPREKTSWTEARPGVEIEDATSNRVDE